MINAEIGIAAVGSVAMAAIVYYGVQLQGSFLVFWITYFATLCVGIGAARVLCMMPCSLCSDAQRRTACVAGQLASTQLQMQTRSRAPPPRARAALAYTIAALSPNMDVAK